METIIDCVCVCCFREEGRVTLATRLITTVFTISRLANRVELNCSTPCRKCGPSFDDDGPQNGRQNARPSDSSLSIKR